MTNLTLAELWSIKLGMALAVSDWYPDRFPAGFSDSGKWKSCEEG